MFASAFFFILLHVIAERGGAFVLSAFVEFLAI